MDVIDWGPGATGDKVSETEVVDDRTEFVEESLEGPDGASQSNTAEELAAEVDTDTTIRDDAAPPSEEIEAIQNALMTVGYPPANVVPPSVFTGYGVFEYHTQRAVKKVQKKAGLTVTGDWDAETAAWVAEKARPRG